MKRSLALGLALCLSLSLLAGCGQGDTSNDPATGGEDTSAIAPAGEAGQVQQPEGETTSALPKETLVAALDACVSYEEGTAGCSLKATQAAADLVACAKDLKETDLQAVAVAAKEWYDALPADRQQVFQENWSAIETDARTLARDPASMLEALDEAGVDTDFSVMDLTQAEGLVDALRTALVQA